MYSALRALRAIQAAGMQPNVVTYCGIIAAFTRRRRQREQQLGYHLWCELQSSALRLDAAAYRTGKQISIPVPAVRWRLKMHIAGSVYDKRECCCNRQLSGAAAPVYSSAMQTVPMQLRSGLWLTSSHR